jgi:hypothetical protein
MLRQARRPLLHRCTVKRQGYGVPDRDRRDALLLVKSLKRQLTRDNRGTP